MAATVALRIAIEIHGRYVFLNEMSASRGPTIYVAELIFDFLGLLPIYLRHRAQLTHRGRAVRTSALLRTTNEM